MYIRDGPSICPVFIFPPWLRRPYAGVTPYGENNTFSRRLFPVLTRCRPLHPPRQWDQTNRQFFRESFISRSRVIYAVCKHTHNNVCISSPSRLHRVRLIPDPSHRSSQYPVGLRGLHRITLSYSLWPFDFNSIRVVITTPYTDGHYTFWSKTILFYIFIQSTFQVKQ